MKSLNILLSSLVVLFILNDSYGQNFVWQDTFGLTLEDEVFESLELISSKRIFCVGTTNDGKKRIITKMDTSGQIIWSKNLNIDTASESQIFRIKKIIGESNFIVMGASREPGLFQYDFVAKIDSSADTIWTYKYSNSNFYSTINDLLILPDKSVLTCGFVNTVNGEEIYLRRLDSLGDLIWEKDFSYTGFQDARKLLDLFDGSILILSRSNNNHLWLKIDLNGNVINDTTIIRPANTILSGGFSVNTIYDNESFVTMDFLTPSKVFSNSIIMRNDFNSASLLNDSRYATDNDPIIFIDSLASFIRRPDADTVQLSIVEIYGNNESIINLETDFNDLAIRDHTFFEDAIYLCGRSTSFLNDNFWVAKIEYENEKFIPDPCLNSPEPNFSYTFNDPLLVLKDSSFSGLEFLDTIYSWQWNTSVGNFINMDSISLFIDTTVTKTMTVELIISNWYGCTDTIQKTLDFGPNGISEIDRHQNVKVYPNPTNGDLFLEFDQAEEGEISIFDLNGKEVFNKRLQSKKELIDLRELQSGVYFYSINTRKKIIKGKIVISK